MKSKRKKPAKAAKAHVRAETWQNMTVIAHAFVPHPDTSKPFCAECGWPRGNHLA